MTEVAAPPLAGVKSIDEILAYAHAMEREAAARYAMLADCMHRVDQREIAKLLEELAAEERGHVDSVERLAQQRLHRTPDPALVRWELPATFSGGDEAGAAALLSPYQALSIAVRNEERAFTFWTYVAAQAEFAALCELAEVFAHEELIHAAKLRRARRQAYHAQRGRHRQTPRNEPSEAEVRAEAARLEGEFAALCAAAAEQLRSGSDPITVALFESLGDEAQRRAAAPASEPDQQSMARRARSHGTNGAALLFEAAGLIENLDYFYRESLESSAREEMVRELEARAQTATARLARINERLYALEPAIAAIGKRSGKE
jgi:rubrerythrin